MRRVAVAPHVLEFASDDPAAARAVHSLYHAAPVSMAEPTLRFRITKNDDGTYLGHAPTRPAFGPATLAQTLSFVEWRATEDMIAPMGGVVFLHAAAVAIGGRLTLLVGDSGAGKSTVAAHLLVRGHRVLGDDLVRFAPDSRLFSAVARSFKLDDNSLSQLPLVAYLCSAGAVGTLLASGCYYVSPAAIRRDWEAPAGQPVAVVFLERTAHQPPTRLEPMSEGEAAVLVTQSMMGVGAGGATATRGPLTVRLLESLSALTAYRAGGDDPAALALALERRLAA
jgi:hypothetical protein